MFIKQLLTIQIEKIKNKFAIIIAAHQEVNIL